MKESNECFEWTTRKVRRICRERESQVELRIYPTKIELKEKNPRKTIENGMKSYEKLQAHTHIVGYRGRCRRCIFILGIRLINSTTTAWIFHHTFVRLAQVNEPYSHAQLQLWHFIYLLERMKTFTYRNGRHFSVYHWAGSIKFINVWICMSA